MISRVFSLLRRSFAYIQNHPQVLFVITLLVLFPLLFLYTGQQFLDVGRANQDRLQKDQIGTLHDSLSILLSSTDFDVQKTNTALQTYAHLNDAIVEYAIVKEINGEMKAVASQPESASSTIISDIGPYSAASLRVSESIIFETYVDGERFWSAYRAVRTGGSDTYFIYTKTSLATTDTLFAARESQAYFSLLFVYCFVIALAYWHVRLTDYRFLYIQAQKANQMKDLFTNMIAHELRAPLTAVRGYADLLESSVTTAEHRQQANRIKESSQRMLTILNDLLDVARIQSGKMAMKQVQVNVSEIVQKVFDELKVIAAEKHIALVQENQINPTMVDVDPERLQQVVTNIITNAIKYTKQGSVSVAIADMHAFIEVRFKDTGMGIASEDQKKLFAPFFRVASTDVSNITGTGLGMWITKEIVELMHGSITVESIKGVGTHVVLKLPKPIRIN